MQQPHVHPANAHAKHSQTFFSFLFFPSTRLLLRVSTRSFLKFFTRLFNSLFVQDFEPRYQSSRMSALAASHTSVPTPIRAITTPLRSSTAPPIPPASQLYEPLAKAVLRRRLARRIFPYSLGVAGVACLAFGFFFGFGSASRSGGNHTHTHKHGAGGGVGGVVLEILGLWVAGVLPVIFLRKAYLTVTHTSAPSPLQLVKNSLAPPLRTRTLAALQTHVLSALGVLAVHVVLDGGVPVFVKSRKHPYTPHPALVFLALTQMLLAALYVLRTLLRDVWVVPFRAPTLTPTPAAVLAPLFLALLAPPVALVLLFVVLPVVRWVPIVSLPLRPLLAPILTPRLFLLRFAPRAVALAAQTAWAWEGTGGVWGWGVGEPLHTAHASPTTRVRALVSGISVAATPPPAPSTSGSSFTSAASSAFSTPLRRTSMFLPSQPGSGSSFFAPAPAPPAPAASGPPPPISIYTHLAYAELLRLASDANAAAARTEGVFGVDGEVWGRLVREVLVLLGREYRVLLGRGVPEAASPSKGAAVGTSTAATPAATVAGAATATTPGLAVTPSPLIKKNIFAPTTPSRGETALEAILSVVAESPPSSHSHPAPKTPAKTHTEVHTQAKASTPTEQWQLRPLLVALVPAIPVPSWVRGVLDMMLEAGGAVTGATLPRAWTEARKGREAAGWVPRREVCVEAVGVLTHLTCASLTEDRFGVVQRDIPRILEALIAFLAAVEDAQAALRPQSHATDAKMPEAEKEVLEVLGAVAAAERGAEGTGKDAAETERERELKRERARARAMEAAHLEEARGVLGEVGGALKDGIARIVLTFGDKLRAFRFPPRTAARLQGFVEYCA
ncbi:hypothetical protein MSAN_00146400 [Mycena sanguinolenta]|uniref:Uncharacterized protein n=1 Tax=Mycena sanguinolenta TaxID=230812 RepID=A0A8H7DN36_9AGAR|nr:hypothetical protein MSAN_00146400 [Mycena sanguinolenta]